MRSDLIKEGPSRAPHRSLLRALGIDELEMKRPFVAVVNSKSDYIPGHMHLDKIAEQVKAGIRNAGGVPFEFNTIGVCDGIAMNHKGMILDDNNPQYVAACIDKMVKDKKLRLYQVCFLLRVGLIFLVYLSVAALCFRVKVQKLQIVSAFQSSLNM